jgi:hypothetical protein
MNNENCLANILKVINVLQNNAEDNCDVNNSCTRPFLGDIPNIVCFNTRLITLYRCDNSLVTLPYTLDGTTATTTIFRVENVTCDSVTVLLIRDNGDGTYTNTNTFATINLGCICAIRCIGDTTIANV